MLLCMINMVSRAGKFRTRIKGLEKPIRILVYCTLMMFIHALYVLQIVEQASYISSYFIGIDQNDIIATKFQNHI